MPKDPPRIQHRRGSPPPILLRLIRYLLLFFPIICILLLLHSHIFLLLHPLLFLLLLIRMFFLSPLLVFNGQGTVYCTTPRHPPTPFIAPAYPFSTHIIFIITVKSARWKGGGGVGREGGD